jgi:hypothetical protein
MTVCTLAWEHITLVEIWEENKKYMKINTKAFFCYIEIVICYVLNNLLQRENTIYIISLGGELILFAPYFFFTDDRRQ